MTDLYELPLVTRYASRAMAQLFSPQKKYATWRRLWVALARGEQAQGMRITDAQIAELENHIDTIDFATVARYEKQTKHEVMAHIHAYAEQCPNAAGIIHLGATSSYVMDNGDLCMYKEALDLLYQKLLHLLECLAEFARNYAETPCVGYTHFQTAQPTTLGKRAAGWLYDLYTDTLDVKRLIDSMPFLGVKGATGTQSAFLDLLGSDDKVHKLEAYVTKQMGFSKACPIATQTYPRKFDYTLSTALATIAVSLHKWATDIRLLSHTGEMSEPFESDQVGSSAMPYKRNPMRSERICSIARFVISLSENAAYTAALQWLERSLDDSANRRLALPQQFLGIDALLNSAVHLVPNLVVHLKVIEEKMESARSAHIQERIMMDLAKQGYSRQAIHEELRTAKNKKSYEDNYSDTFSDTASFTGRAADQVHSFLKECIDPLLEEKRAVDIPSQRV